MNQANGSSQPNMNHPRRKFKTNDPQIIVQGELKAGEKADLIVFTIPLALIELVCIVTIPPEGETRAPVYVKFKVQRPARQPQTSTPGYTVDGD